MKIAIIGSGISGNTAAHYLHKEHDITVFESADYAGGHTHTHSIIAEDQTIKVDSGFIVFNQRTYPNFNRLLTELDVPVQASDMSFSVQCEKTGLEYNGTNLNGLFSQRNNMVSLKFYKMLHDIIRFNRDAREVIKNGSQQTLGEYLLDRQYSEMFVDNYLIPMTAAIWSTDAVRAKHYPVRSLFRFFYNHGMLSINDRPQWYVVKNGSNSYVNKLMAPFRHRVLLNTPVDSVMRRGTGVVVKPRHRPLCYFDRVIFACHSDQALKLLSDATEAEKQVLGAIKYQSNEAVLHWDESVLPKIRRSWAAWNYFKPKGNAKGVAVTYNMNILQQLQSRKTYCVSLNLTDRIDPGKIINTMNYDHPLFDENAVRSQQRWGEISGVNNTYYCGAYWGYGFHEDGVNSGLAVVEQIQRELEREKLHLLRTG